MADDVELLERAAALLDRLLAGATPGRWRVDRPWVHDRAGKTVWTDLVYSGPDREAVLLGVPDLGTDRDSSGDLAYAAALGPQVGRALAALFRQAACMGRMDPDLLHRLPCDEVIDVARAILGEEGESGA